MNRKVYIVARKRLQYNTRILRQASTLTQEGIDVEVICLGRSCHNHNIPQGPGMLSFHEIELTSPLKKAQLTIHPALRLIKVMGGLFYYPVKILGPLILSRLNSAKSQRRFAQWLYGSLLGLRQALRMLRRYGRRVLRKLLSSKLLTAVPRLIKIFRYQSSFTRKAFQLIREGNAVAVQLHDSQALDLIPLLKKNPNTQTLPILYDAVEIPFDRSGAFREHQSTLFSTLIKHKTARLIRQCTQLICVSEGVATQLKNYYQAPLATIILNCRHHCGHHPSVSTIKHDCGLQQSDILILYINTMYPGQGVEQLIDSISYLPSHYHVAVLGPQLNVNFLKTIQALIDQNHLQSRFHILPEQPQSKLLTYASGADIGVIPRQNTSLNNYHSLPNRIFEYIMARLPIAGPNLMDMKQFIQKNKIGMIFDEANPQDIARTIIKMSEPSTFSQLKHNLDLAAKTFIWEVEGQKYLAIIHNLLKSPRAKQTS